MQKVPGAYSVLLYFLSLLSTVAAQDVSKITSSVSVISSDPPCKNSKTRFTTVPLKPLTDQGCRTVSYRSTKTLLIV